MEIYGAGVELLAVLAFFLVSSCYSTATRGYEHAVIASSAWSSSSGSNDYPPPPFAKDEEVSEPFIATSTSGSNHDELPS